MDASKTTVNWNVLNLSGPHAELLRDMTLRMKQKPVSGWLHKFMPRIGRRGVTALFTGCNAPAKMLAAQWLAKEAGIGLHRIDLSQLVNKYIGETEKNLARVFDAASASNVVLLLDEADALFGQRSEVKDSHDRYANLEANFLLQRLEAYSGVVILTTNNKSTLDQAMLRRFQYVIDFPC